MHLMYITPSFLFVIVVKIIVQCKPNYEYFGLIKIAWYNVMYFEQN